MPEMEGKLVLADPTDAERAGDALVDWARSLPGARLLLPSPARIVRLRRYHVCEHPGDRRQWTVVETMSGRLSVKVKGGAREEGGALVRDTVASHDTETTGAQSAPAAFLARHGPHAGQSLRQAPGAGALRDGRRHGVLRASLAAGGLGVSLQPTMVAKHDFFCGCADEAVPDAA